MRNWVGRVSIRGDSIDTCAIFLSQRARIILSICMQKFHPSVKSCTISEARVCTNKTQVELSGFQTHTCSIFFFEWNPLTLDIRNSTSIAEFKRKLQGIIRPAQKPTYSIHDIAGIRLLTKLRLNFSALNEHKFRHNFECLDPICACGTGKEDNEHFLLHCPLFELQRRDLLGQLGDLPGIDIVSLDSETICKLLLFGSPN